MQSLLQFFGQRRSEKSPLVLATVVGTEGSTYSKTGERLLVDENGIYRGLLSGGCLEGDLAVRARQVIETEQPQLVNYDFRGEDDELFGMGVGCEGAIHVLLQSMTVSNDYQPFATIAELVDAEHSAVLATSLAANNLGAAFVARGHSFIELGLSPSSALQEASNAVSKSGQSVCKTINEAGRTAEILFAAIKPAPRLLILGGGPDVVPLVRMASELGWRCRILDHRPAYIERLPLDFSAMSASADNLAGSVRLDDFDRALVMSHHLASDRSYLRQLADSSIRYIGLLGPPARRDRLLSDLGGQASGLQGRLHGPAGLDIGGRGPAAIALSILAEMQQLLHDD